ncbi:UNKNOWN [Stylonychia lemnae]|uniref:Uncharacterized protein n=1 Tax=Stylonychia lemnae TaxID=5949 RepID=A0A078B934_STYLE|nr:UNKNOWN [Stylonychia lemnae]|eukprot:CDW90073.1 UNKNOWN [Stylonychia lemnae]
MKTRYIQKSNNKFQGQLYIPGKTPGQPYKENQHRFCYSITKRMGKRANQHGDKFDFFLYQADRKINFYKPSYLNEDNPYNPLKLETEIKIHEVDEEKFQQIKDQMKSNFGMTIDDLLAVEVFIILNSIFQGCMEDDKTLLGGRNQFLSHFCTLFNFNICYSALESKAIKKQADIFNDSEQLDKKIDDWFKKFDDIK